MSVNAVNSDGSLLRVAGGTLYADAPIGEIHAFGGSVIPSGYLLCDGQTVSRTVYAELFAVIGTAFGEGDGSTTFNVPDLRECVLVGAGESTRAEIAEHDVYTVGEFKDDQVGLYNARINNRYGGSSSGSGLYTESRVSPFADWLRNVTNDYRNGTTTHGKQLGVNYIIKAKQVAVPFDVAEYIRNQNVLSDIERIALSTNANNPTIFEYDGEFICYIQAFDGPGQNIYIKDDSGTYKQVGSVYQRDIFSYSVKKGWQMYATGWNNGVGQVAYYKLRDYTGR